jgi:hypothetical protein
MVACPYSSIALPLRRSHFVVSDFYPPCLTILRSVLDYPVPFLVVAYEQVTTRGSSPLEPHDGIGAMR